MKKSPLKTCSLTIMVIAFVVILLVSSYALGIDILSRIFTWLPEPDPVSYTVPLLIFSEVITPLFFLLGSTAIILLSLRHVLAQKRFYGVKSEFILIANSLIMIGLGLQVLADNIPYKNPVQNVLYSNSVILAVLAVISLVAGIMYKYLVDSKPDK